MEAVHRRSLPGILERKINRITYNIHTRIHTRRRDEERRKRLARERNEKLQNPEYLNFRDLTPGRIKRKYGVSVSPLMAGEVIYINPGSHEIRLARNIGGKRYPVKGIATTTNFFGNILGDSCGYRIDDKVAKEAYYWSVGSVRADERLNYERHKRGLKTRKGLVFGGAIALTLAGVMAFNQIAPGRINLEGIINSIPGRVYQTTPTDQQGEEVVVSPQNKNQNQGNMIQIPRLDDLNYAYDVDSVCEVIAPGDVFYRPGGDVAFSGVPQPKWVVDIKRLHAKDGFFCEGNYEIWAEITDKWGGHPELENGWFKVRGVDDIYALCGEWLLKGKVVNELVDTYLQVYPDIGKFKDGGDNKYSINFNNQEEALLWVYILSEGNYDASIERMPQPYQQQQYDLLDAALLNIIQRDEQLNGDGILGRLASGRYHGVLYGDPFSGLYNQALNGNTVTISSASIDLERAARVRAVIDLSPQVIPEGVYTYIINPKHDGVNMIESLNIVRNALVGPVGLQCFGRN